MEDSRRLKDLATQFFAEIAPKGMKDLDSLFERWKTDVPRKQEVNFGLALPPSMRERILKDIGLLEPSQDPSQIRYLGYLKILNRLMERNIEDLLEMNHDQITALVWQEGRRLNMLDPEIQEMAVLIPVWIKKISNKVIFEFSPMNIFEVTKIAEGKQPLAKGSRAKFQDIIGRSDKMQSIFSCIERISKSNLSVLIQGESGTGKELVAHAIHINSPKSNESFIPVNCGALPDSIIESELFGHEKGAFTGAIVQKVGYFELANRGTIFLDEISETSLSKSSLKKIKSWFQSLTQGLGEFFLGIRGLETFENWKMS
ncbi:sigma 54-interacting transcriptional regulator [bacterium]|nr:sigma 54-interacting transcriptional regulator [bacterium]